MDKYKWLSILYYDIGKQQSVDLQTQHSKILEGNKIFFKRKYALDIIGRTDEFSHRTILINEIIIDIDPDTRRKEKIETIFPNMSKDLKSLGLPHFIYFTGSKGYHIHIYDNKMFFMDKREREQHRLKICSRYLQTFDKAVCVESHMIATEFCAHWKTNNDKKLIMRWGFDDIKLQV
jgi:hypothetical protein